MSRRRYNPADYEPCPSGCGRQRWKALTLPVCSWCQRYVMDAEWIYLRQRLLSDHASLDVLIPLDQAIARTEARTALVPTKVWTINPIL